MSVGPQREDFHVGIPFGGILFRDLPKIRELLTAEEYEKLLKRLLASPDGREGHRRALCLTA